MTRSRDVANIDTILTTKGDIYAASAAYTPTRLAVGSNNQVLTADSAQTTGLKWATPTTPGLVAMAPTSTANSGGTISTSGGTVTFSGVTSVSLNGVFNSSYDNYRVMFRAVGTADQALSFRLRASGTDNTSANYNVSRGYILASSVNPGNSITREQELSATSARVFFTGTRSGISSFDLFRVFDAETTLAVGASQTSVGNTEILFTPLAYHHNVATSYDGITFFASNSFTGIVTIYGYAK